MPEDRLAAARSPVELPGWNGCRCGYGGGAANPTGLTCCSKSCSRDERCPAAWVGGSAGCLGAER
eukprot:353695-Chlamydomonas_euryale.AAC.10